MQNTPDLNSSPLSNLYTTSQTQTTISIFYIKIFYLIIIWAIAFVFGLLPLCFNNCRKDLRLLNYANAFSAGIFLGIGFFHLMPEASESFENYFLNEGSNSIFKNIPISYLLAFLSYCFILYIEKVAFNSHALIAHTHGDELSIENDENLDELKEPLISGSFKNNKKIYHDCTNDLYDEENNNNDIDLFYKQNREGNDEIGNDEQIIRNIISSKGQFSSVLHSRNLSKFKII